MDSASANRPSKRDKLTYRSTGMPGTATAARKLRVFLSYASEDRVAVRELHAKLEALGLNAWMDREDLLPGQNWELEIRDALHKSDAVIVYLTRQSVKKIGYIQKEIRKVLEIAEEQPHGAIFVIPVKGEDCEVPGHLGEWHWANLYEPDGLDHLMASLRARADSLGIEWSFRGVPPPQQPATTTSLRIPPLSRRSWFAGIAGLAAAGAGVLYLRPHASSRMRSIAVLPFRSLEAGDKEPYVGVGITDALIGKLATLKNLAVRPTGAVLKYSKPDQDPIAAGRELTVDTVLDGHFQKAGDFLRLSVQLVAVKDGALLWTGKLEEAASSLFTMQDSIAQQVANVLLKPLGVNVGEFEARQLAKRSTSNLPAYDLYTRGRFEMLKRTPQAYFQAIDYLERAVAADPGFALAWASLSFCYAAQSGTRPPKNAFPQALEAARKAIAGDGDLAEAHVALAIVSFQYEWNWRQAETEFRRGLALGPNNVSALYSYGVFLFTTAHFSEAESQLARARQLLPDSMAVHLAQARLAYMTRNFDGSAAILKDVAARFPKAADPRLYLAEVYLRQSKPDEACTEASAAVNLEPENSAAASVLGQAFAAANREDEARAVIAKLTEARKVRYLPASVIADIHIALGETDAAIEHLKEAQAERAYPMVLLNVDPKYDSIRTDPRFRELASQFGG